jgi:hypothetical protein
MNPPPENPSTQKPSTDNPSKTESITDTFLEFYKTMCDSVISRQKLQNACAEYTLNADKLKFLYLRKIILFSRLNFFLLILIVIILLFRPFSSQRPPENEVPQPVSAPSEPHYEIRAAPTIRSVA